MRRSASSDVGGGTGGAAAAAAKVPCGVCGAALTRKQVFQITFKSIIISDFLQRYRGSGMSPSAKTASSSGALKAGQEPKNIRIQEEMNWVPEIILAQDMMAKENWPQSLADSEFLATEVQSCETCCVQIMDRVMDYTHNDGVLLHFPRPAPKPKRQPLPSIASATPPPPAPVVRRKPAAKEEEPKEVARKPRVPTFKRPAKSSANKENHSNEEDEAASSEARTTDSFFLTGI